MEEEFGLAKLRRIEIIAVISYIDVKDDYLEVFCIVLRKFYPDYFYLYIDTNGYNKSTRLIVLRKSFKYNIYMQFKHIELTSGL